MRIVATVARYLFGILFTVFGLNGFLQFIHQPPPTNPLALQFLVVISASHFSASFFAVQVLAGLLLLSGYFVPLALVLLAAEIFNILAFHLTMAPATIGPGLVVALLWVLVFLQYRGSFEGILSARRMGRNESEGAARRVACGLAITRPERENKARQCGVFSCQGVVFKPDFDCNSA